MNRTAFYEALRPKLGKLRQSQVDGMERLLTAVAGRPISHAAYLLASAYHETGGTMQPVSRSVLPNASRTGWTGHGRRASSGR